MNTLRKRVADLEADTAPARGFVVLVGTEPEPIDATDNDDAVLRFGLVEADGTDVPPLDLDKPLPRHVEEALARQADGAPRQFSGYHRWDASTREFVSPHGLRRPALPR